MAIMEKRVLLGVKKRKVPINKSSKKKLFPKKVVDYLKSDSYLFAPLSSSSSSTSNFCSHKTVEIKEKAKENDRNLLKKVEDYLLSDSYMYASLVVPPKSLLTLSKGPQRCVKRVTMEVLRSSITLKDSNQLEKSKNDLPEKFLPDRRSLVHKETVTQMMYQNCRSCQRRECLARRQGR